MHCIYTRVAIAIVEASPGWMVCNILIVIKHLIVVLHWLVVVGVEWVATWGACKATGL